MSSPPELGGTADSSDVELSYMVIVQIWKVTSSDLSLGKPISVHLVHCISDTAGSDPIHILCLGWLFVSNTRTR